LQAENGSVNPDVLTAALMVLNELVGTVGLVQDARDAIVRVLSAHARSFIEPSEYEKTILGDEFVAAVAETNWAVFDSKAWNRGSANVF
jgi:hypothetical protein